MKPILACDANLETCKWPKIAMPKIDGVRGVDDNGLVARSGKRFPNILNTQRFSRDIFKGFDGEMVVDAIVGDGICNLANSALTTIHGTVKTRWCLFDLSLCPSDPYHKRLSDLELYVDSLLTADPSLSSMIWVVPHVVVNCKEEFEAIEDKWIEQGFEGAILRDPNGKYKFGRCTEREDNYTRVKRFMDSEIVVTKILEGQINNNDTKRTPHGYIERSTHAENMIPSGMIGTIIGTAVEDVVFKGRVIIREGQEVDVSPGKMSHGDRLHYWENPSDILGKLVKYQHFPVGVKDKPRFPTFQCFRDPVDMV